MTIIIVGSSAPWGMQHSGYMIFKMLQYSKSVDQTYSAPTHYLLGNALSSEKTDKNKHSLWPQGAHSLVGGGRRVAGQAHQ